MAQQDNAIYLETVAFCGVCGHHGETLYSNLQDRLFVDRPRAFGVKRCLHCGHVWLTPRFTLQCIGHAYRGYSDDCLGDPPLSSSRRKLALKQAYFAAAWGYTAGTSLWQRLVGYAFYLHPPLRRKLDRQVMFLARRHSGRLLDIGCASGWFLQNMQWLGWKVEGVDIDPVGAEKARKRGIAVRLGTLEGQHYPDNIFDAITMSHVVEHLHKPIATLQECYRILKPGGRIVIITPNTESMAHKRFKEFWMPLDTPRHLNLFTSMSMTLAVERAGFRIEEGYCAADGAAGFWSLSSAIESTGSLQLQESPGIRARLKAYAFYATESLRLLWDQTAGEEIILVGRK